MDINNLWSGYNLNSKKQNSRCLAVNTILEGKYLVGPVLGQGGFGITYVGYDLNMEAKIAIKEYFPVELVSRDTTTMHGDRVLSLSGEKSVTYKAGLKKYVAEAQNVSQFSEIPGVVSVKDFFYANETAYIVMEYIDGISLKDYLKEKGGRLTEEETLKIMKPVLEALVQVHKAGIIHRDISPDNIMLTFKDANVHNQIESVKLIDFGAARMTEKNDQKSLTIILKHGYAPEEQYRTHGEQGPWTDVYALCAVLYRMLTGETPVPAMDRMFQDDLKTLKALHVNVSENTESAILKGLAVKKSDRLQSVQELIAILYDGVKVSAKKSKEGNKKSVAVAAAAAVAVVGIAGAVFLAGGSKKEVNVQEIQNSQQPETVFADQNGAAVEMSGETNAVEFMDEEALLGEQVAFYHPQNSMSSNGDDILICKPDGSVVFKGTNDEGEGDVQDWSHIVSVKLEYAFSLGLRSDGTVVAAGDNDAGQCDVEGWSDVVQIDTGHRLSVGLTKDGDVLVAGKKNMVELEQLASWSDMKDIALIKWGDGQVTGIVGLKNDGSIVLLAGEESELDTSIEISGWDDVAEIFISGGDLYGIDEDGICKGAHITLYGGDCYDYEYFYERESESDKTRMKQVHYGFDGVRADGKYYANVEEWSKVTSWTNLISVGSVGGSFGWKGYYGLQEDGTILEDMHYAGNAEWEDFKDLEWVYAVSGVIGRTKDGELLYCGYNSSYEELREQLVEMSQQIVEMNNGNCLFDDGTVRVSWDLEQPIAHNIKQIVPYDSYASLGVTEDGMVVPVDDFEIPDTVAGWKDIIQIGVTDSIDESDSWIYGLQSDGTVISLGENAPEIKDIKQLAISEGLTLGLKNDGTVVELSVRKTEMLNESSYYLGGIYLDLRPFTDIQDLQAGTTHVVGLKSDGTVVATGNNQNGQCDVEGWKDVVYLAVDGDTTLGITKDGDLLIAGLLQR